MTDNDIIECFNAIAAEAFRIAKDHGFHETELNDGEQIALMHSELSEGLEAIRKDLDSDHIEGFKGSEEELADVIIRIGHYAKRRQLRVGEAIVAKMKFNETRPYKHGGKKF